MSGILGIELNNHCWEEMSQAIAVIQPRGDEWGGFAAMQGKAIIRDSEKGKIIRLLEREGPRLKEEVREAIASVSQKDPQPARIEETKMGPIALAFDGKITNREELQEKSPFLVGSDTSIFARLVAAAKDPLEGLKNVYNNVKGPFSLVLLTREGLFAACDILGIRPLAIGRFLGDDKVGCAVASESAALEHIGMKVIRDVKPGEIIKIQTAGFKSLTQIKGPGLVICGFEYGYWARPSSVIETIPVGLARYNAGTKLGWPEADIIAGLPMSGNSAAEGLHYISKIPYRSVFDFNIEAGGRSFLPLNSEERKKRAKSKLLIMTWAVLGMRVVIVDDSIVEGNQTLARIFLIRKSGAKEVHLRIETPMMKYSCPFDIIQRGELMAATHNEEEIKKLLGVNSLEFNSVENYAEAIILAQNEERKERSPLTVRNLCLGCFTGNFPQYK